MVDLSVKFAGMEFKNPVMPAAGPPVRNGHHAHLAKAGGAGGIVTKTISVEAAKVPRPCMAQVKRGFLNTELWSELPPEKWLETEYKIVKETGLPVIVGLGYTGDDIRKLAPQVAPYADALELSTHYLGNDATPVVEAITAARETTDLPVFVKLSPQIDIPFFAKKAEEAGAAGLVLINSLGPCLDIDVHTKKPLMGSKGGYGWLSGEAIFPVALRAVFDAAQAVDIPVIGVGGISSGIDAIKMLMAGAQAIQVCTATILKGPNVYGRIVGEMEKFMVENGYQSISELIGTALPYVPKEANFEVNVPVVNQQICTACGLCKVSCAYQAIEVEEAAAISSEQCFGCGLCVTRCPVGAISYP